ncbi:MAG: aminoacetone oxidase family FAD-binding enzyme, partial [Planctomycetes bacterium]|nr:aminoacetone oxidase family FAD-binding enzyme [Planctomycetota bacterium]
MIKCDVCVIGGGAAGLMAGIFAAKAGVRTMIIEANPTAGRKLLRTGRGRCNLTHTGSIDDFVRAYGPFGRFVQHSLYEFSPDDVRGFFAEKGLRTKVEKNGCVFPITDRAADVKRILVDTGRRLGIEFVYGRRIEAVEKCTGGFFVKGSGDLVCGKTVIIATGGVSWSFTGSTGDGLRFAADFGHEIVEPRSALAPLVTAEAWPGELEGLGLDRVCIITELGDKKLSVTGPMMFTGDGIGGPAVFDLSRLITDVLAEGAEPIEAWIDLLPDVSHQELDELVVARCSAAPKKELAGAIAAILPRAMVLKLCHWLCGSRIVQAGQLPKAKRVELVNMIKGLVVTVEAVRPIAEATITRGGVDTGNIDSKT